MAEGEWHVGEWHVVKYRKNRLRVSVKPSPCSAMSNSNSTTILQVLGAGEVPTAPGKDQELQVLMSVAGGTDTDNALDEKFCHQKQELLAKYKKSKDRVKTSDFYKIFLEQLRDLELAECRSWFPTASSTVDAFGQSGGLDCQALEKGQQIQLVVYGLGSIDGTERSRCQLSLALLLKESLPYVGRVLVHDPILTRLERCVLEDLGCFPMIDNCNGNLRFSEPTLFYMPHCSLQLYVNVVASNMHLVTSSQVVILGNSFNSYIAYLPVPLSVVKADCPWEGMRRMCDRVVEYPIDEMRFPDNSAFNSTSWHLFPAGRSCPGDDF